MSGAPKVPPEKIERIKKLLGKHNQYEIARMVGVSQNVVSRINTGIYNPKKSEEFFEHDPWYSYNPKR